MKVAVLEKQAFIENKPVPGVWELMTVGKDEDIVISCLDGVQAVFEQEFVQNKIEGVTIFFNDHVAFRIRIMEVIEK